MELDDLKKQWQMTTPVASADAVKEAIGKKMLNIERSGRRIKRAFWFEMIFVWVVYFMFLGVMWFFNEHVQPFMYKIVILIGIATIPIVWRLYKMQKRVDTIDYSMDVRSNIIGFVKYYKRSLLIYEWGTYVISAISAIILYLDPAFMALKPNFIWTFFGYMLLVVVITRPYIYYVYGKKVSAFEDFLKD